MKPNQTYSMVVYVPFHQKNGEKQLSTYSVGSSDMKQDDVT